MLHCGSSGSWPKIAFIGSSFPTHPTLRAGLPWRSPPRRGCLLGRQVHDQERIFPRWTGDTFEDRLHTGVTRQPWPGVDTGLGLCTCHSVTGLVWGCARVTVWPVQGKPEDSRWFETVWQSLEKSAAVSVLRNHVCHFEMYLNMFLFYMSICLYLIFIYLFNVKIYINIIYIYIYILYYIILYIILYYYIIYYIIYFLLYYIIYYYIYYIYINIMCACVFIHPRILVVLFFWSSNCL